MINRDMLYEIFSHFEKDECVQLQYVCKEWNIVYRTMKLPKINRESLIKCIKDNNMSMINWLLKNKCPCDPYKILLAKDNIILFKLLLEYVSPVRQSLLKEYQRLFYNTTRNVTVRRGVYKRNQMKSEAVTINKDIINLLLDNGCRIDFFLLEFLLQYEEISYIKSLYPKYMSLNENIFEFFVYLGSLEIVEWLSSLSCKMSSKCWTVAIQIETEDEESIQSIKMLNLLKNIKCPFNNQTFEFINMGGRYIYSNFHRNFFEFFYLLDDEKEKYFDESGNLIWENVN